MSTRTRARIRYGLTRPPLIITMIALVAACVHYADRVRHTEADATAFLLRAVGYHAVNQGPYNDVLIQVTPFYRVGLFVALSCSSVMVLPGLLGMTGLALALRPLPVWRCLAALTAATALFEVCNLVRLVGLCAVEAQWGVGSTFEFVHTWVGTLITLFGLAATLGVYLYLITLGKRRGRGAVPAFAVPA